jgi:DNA-binding transcriptional LysR family regulator
MATNMATKTNTLPFDLRALEIFLSVCEAGTMAQAARALGLTQPAISQAIAELENRTGTTLFDRSVRPLALTPAGGVMRQRASALLSEARQIGPLLRETERGKLSLVRIGLVDSLVRALSVPIATFLAKRAETVQVQSGLTAAHAGALLTRNLDLFIGVDDMVEIAGLERLELFTEPYILLLPNDSDRPETPAELARLASKLPFIRYSARSKTGIDIERHLRRLGLEFPSGLEFDTPFGVTDMVARGQGFAISTPLCLAEAAITPGLVEAVPLPGPKLSRTLTLVARRQEFGSLPRDLTAACKAALAGETMPLLQKFMPWLGKEFGCSP